MDDHDTPIDVGEVIAKRSPSLPATTMHPLVQMVMDSGKFDVATMERVMAMQERHEATEAAKAFEFAMARLKASIPSVIQHDKRVYYEGKTGAATDFTHTRRDTITDTIAGPMEDNGLRLSHRHGMRNGNVWCVARITHVQRHFEESGELEAPPDTRGSKGPAQAVQSTLSMLKRYTTQALLGIETAGPDKPWELATKDPETVDESRIIKTLAAVKRAGREREDAEAFAGRKASEWTNGDIDKIKAWLVPKPPPQAEPAHDPVTGEVVDPIAAQRAGFAVAESKVDMDKVWVGTPPDIMKAHKADLEAAYKERVEELKAAKAARASQPPTVSE